MIWDLMEKPESSTAAQASINHVFLCKCCTFSGCVSDLDELCGGLDHRHGDQHDAAAPVPGDLLPPHPAQDGEGGLIENPRLAMVETICIAWFTLEYFLRMAGAPDKWEFITNGMNISKNSAPKKCTFVPS